MKTPECVKDKDRYASEGFYYQQYLILRDTKAALTCISTHQQLTNDTFSGYNQLYSLL